MRHKLLLIIFTVILLFLLDFPALAKEQSLTHTATYNANGIIDFKKQAGHLCNTGAEMKQEINGDGELSKAIEILMIKGKLEVDDSNEFFAATDALKKITVTTTIKLCSPHKIDYDYNKMIRHNISYRWESEPWLEDEHWTEFWEEIYEDAYEFVGDGDPLDIDPEWDGHFIESGYTISPAIIDLTDQIWAVSLTVDPGNTGILESTFTAAYGGPPMEGHYDDCINRYYPLRVKDADQVDFDKWAYDYYESRRMLIKPNFIGDYFTIDQYAYVSQGEMKRYIDISNPYSHNMIHEDMTVKGSSEVRESFIINNVPTGENVALDWKDLFGADNSSVTIATAEDRNLNHDTVYNLLGNIDLNKQVGHLCNTGAELKQVISGDGELDKKVKINMIEDYLFANDVNEFTTSIDAIKDMSIVSAINLCAPPKQFLQGNQMWLHFFDTEGGGTGYSVHNVDDFYDGGFIAFGPGGSDTLIYGPSSEGSFVHPLLFPNGVPQLFLDDMKNTLDVSDQVWAASVSARPGHRGLLDMNFEAANGPYSLYSPNLDGIFSWSDNWGSYKCVAPSDSWWISTDGKGIFPVIGSDFMGNYFNIEQTTRTSDGELKRFIDISSPWSHGYLHEDMVVTGKAEVKEAFEMNNLPQGTDSGVRWWDLLASRSYTPVYDYYLPGLLVENYVGHTIGTVDNLINYWLWDLLYYYDVDDLIHDELYNLYLEEEWEQVLQRLENEIEDFSRDDAPDLENLIYLPPYILFDFPWPHDWPDWYDLF